MYVGCIYQTSFRRSSLLAEQITHEIAQLACGNQNARRTRQRCRTTLHHAMNCRSE
jgi:hypothetical protein